MNPRSIHSAPLNYPGRNPKAKPIREVFVSAIEADDDEDLNAAPRPKFGDEVRQTDDRIDEDIIGDGDPRGIDDREDDESECPVCSGAPCPRCGAVADSEDDVEDDEEALGDTGLASSLGNINDVNSNRRRESRTPDCTRQSIYPKTDGERHERLR